MWLVSRKSCQLAQWHRVVLPKVFMSCTKVENNTCKCLYVSQTDVHKRELPSVAPVTTPATKLECEASLWSAPICPLKVPTSLQKCSSETSRVCSKLKSPPGFMVQKPFIQLSNYSPVDPLSSVSLGARTLFTYLEKAKNFSYKAYTWGSLGCYKPWLPAVIPWQDELLSPS